MGIFNRNLRNVPFKIAKGMFNISSKSLLCLGAYISRQEWQTANINQMPLNFSFVVQKCASEASEVGIRIFRLYIEYFHRDSKKLW